MSGLVDRQPLGQPGPVQSWPRDAHALEIGRRAALKRFGAGAAALIASPALLPGGRHRAPGTHRTPSAGTAGLAGATLSLAAFGAGATWPQAISTWDGYTATTIGVTKVYYAPGVFPTTIGSEIQACINGIIKALLSFKPAFRPPCKADLAALMNALTMYKNAGLVADVTLWQEAQGVMTRSQYINVVHYYGPSVRTLYPLAYNAAGHVGPTGWQKYYPGDHSVDLVVLDFYANSFVNGIVPDAIGAIADNAKPPKPFGIWEMGSSTTKTSPSQSQIQSYFSYVQSFMSGRLQAGKTNADIAWYNGNGVNTIRSGSDYRVPLWDSLVSATSG